jgi:PKD repeat protein
VLKKISWILFELFSLLLLSLPASSQPGVPDPVKPASARVLPANSLIEFYWGYGIPHAQEFELQISADANFGAVLYAAAGLSGNRHTWNPGNHTGTLYWRVRGMANNQNSNWSNISSFQLFNPASLPGLQLWLKADSGITLQGNKISTWQDLSPNQFLLSQNDTNRRFQLSNRPDGKTYAEAFGNQLFELPLFPWQNENTGFVVGMRTGGLPYGCFFSAPDYLFDCHTNICIIDNTGGTTTVGFWNTDSLSLLSLRRIPGNSAAYYNGQLSPPIATIPLDPLLPGPLRIGDRFDGITDLTGIFGEMIIANTALNDSLKELTETYLMNRFSGEVMLPADTLIASSFCALNVSRPSGIFNAQWQNGSLDPQISISSTQWISITGTDRFGRAVQDSMFIRFPEIVYPNQNFLCKDSLLLWNPIPTAGISFQWNNGSTDDTLFINQAGSYFAELTDAAGCSLRTDTLIITEDYLSFQANLGPDTTLCEGNPVRLTPLPVPGAQYLWSNGDNNEFINAITGGTYSVFAVSPNGCQATDTITINVQGQAPFVDFSFSSGCTLDSIYFQDLSTPPAGGSLNTWSWNFGNNQSSPLVNPATAYSDTGLYYVSLRVTEQNGCGNQTVKALRIYQKPLANAAALNACENSLTSFINQSLAYNGQISQYLWNFGDPLSGANNQSSLQNPNHRYLNPGLFQTQLIVINNAGCSDTLSIPVEVRQKPLAQISYNGHCPNASFNVYSSSQAGFPHQILSNTWNDTLTAPSFPFAGQAPGNYPIQLVSLASNGCRDTLNTLITIDPFPEPLISKGPACAGTTMALSDSGTCIGCTHKSYQWQWNQSMVSQLSVWDTVLFNPQAVQLVLSLSDQRGCVGKDSLLFNVEQAPEALINPPQEIYGAPVSLNFSNASSQVSFNSTWNSANAQASGDVASLFFPEPGINFVQLITRSISGCADTAEIEIDIPQARSDLSIKILSFSPANDGYLRPQVWLKNLGNIPEDQLRLRIQAGGSEPFEESLAGVLYPGDSAIINSSGSFLPQTGLSNLCCAEISKEGWPLETEFSNNRSCSSINDEAEGMDEPFPNPAAAWVQLRIYTVEEKSGTLRIMNPAGQLVRSFDFQRKPGLLELKLDISDLGAGSYQIQLLPENQVRRLLIKGVEAP